VRSCLCFDEDASRPRESVATAASPSAPAGLGLGLISGLHQITPGFSRFIYLVNRFSLIPRHGASACLLRALGGGAGCLPKRGPFPPLVASVCARALIAALDDEWLGAPRTAWFRSLTRCL